MAKATVTLKNGSVVLIEGNIKEIQELLAFYGESQSPARERMPPHTPRKKIAEPVEMKKSQSKPDLSEIIARVKNSDESESIETNILDRTALVSRVLLPLYIVHEYFDNIYGLTSGDINKITTDLGVPVSTPNASRSLSGTASKYVIGDKVRKKGQPVRYKLSRRGVKFLQSIIQGSSGENA